MVLFNAACNHESFETTNLIFPYFRLFSDCIIIFIPCMEMTLIFCLCYYLLCRRGNNHFDVHFRRIGPYFFLSKDGKDAVREGRNGWKGVYFPPESASFSLINNMIKVLFPICTLIWRVNNYVFPPRKGKNRRNESTMIIIKIAAFEYCISLQKITFWLFGPLRLFPSDIWGDYFLIQNNINSVLPTDKLFPQEVWQHWETRGN